MREILFRAKAINRVEGREYRSNYKNGDWVYGLLSKPYIEVGKYSSAAEMTNTSGVSDIEVDYETIGQFTGLTDENGVKIFEGDIVHLYGDKGTDTRFVNYIALVVFAYGGFCAIDGTPDDYAVCRFDFTSTLNCKVIGNIYDNPELIEDGDADEEP